MGRGMKKWMQTLQSWKICKKEFGATRFQKRTKCRLRKSLQVQRWTRTFPSSKHYMPKSVPTLSQKNEIFTLPLRTFCAPLTVPTPTSHRNYGLPHVIFLFLSFFFFFFFFFFPFFLKKKKKKKKKKK